MHNNDIKILQSYYKAEQKNNLDADFTPLDVADNPNPGLRELPIYQKILTDPELENTKYLGLMSHKFGEKTHISGKQFIDFMHSNPGQDVYFINPFPQNAYFSYNVWSHGELFHPGITDLANQLFQQAATDYNQYTDKRNNHSNLLYCNFWVANKKFREHFLSELNALDKAARDLPPKTKQLLMGKTNHNEECIMFPFIIERFFSTFILKHNYKTAAYKYSSEELLNNCMHPMERTLTNRFKEKIDNLDLKGSHTNSDIKLMNNLSAINLEYCKLYYS